MQRMKSDRRRALLTGATGFLGANLTRELLDRNWNVTAIHRPTSDLFRLANLTLDRRTADVMDIGALKRAIPEDTDVVLHLAADLRLTDHATDNQIATNVEGTRNVLTAAREAGVQRCVLVSSMAAFGLHPERIDETVPSNALELPIGYFRTKRLAEIEADRAIDLGLEVTIVNPAIILGPFDAGNMPAMYIRRIARGEMPLTGAGRASFCHARAVGAAIVNAIDRGRIGERYLLGGVDATLKEIGQRIAEITGGTAPTETLPQYTALPDPDTIAQIASRAGYNFFTPQLAFVISNDMLVDSSKAIAELGYVPRTLDQMISDQVNWLRDWGLF